MMLRYISVGLLAICFSGLGGLVSAQTIVVGNKTIVADESNVAPACQEVGSILQLTDAVLSNLTAQSLTNISLFDFADESIVREPWTSGKCKVFPGDELWPDETVWQTFDLLSGGALIKDVPIASPCYSNWDDYNAAECEYITDKWSNVSLHYPNPSSLMFPLWEGATCMPTSVESNNCTLGGYPYYIVNATNIAQIQLAVNFARNTNVRLVIKNTGHDFLGRSAGAGSLSIWTHHFKDIEFIENYVTTDYTGPVFKIGAGVQNFEMYEAAEQYGVTSVGGVCTTVGVGGGYLAGGGHSPMSPKYGIGADQVLSVDVVTPDGRFVTANATSNTDLFWALRGGGASTFGVTTSWTVKVHPKLEVASVTKFSLTSGNGFSTDTLWAAIKIYWEAVLTYNAAGNYEYWGIFPGANRTLTFMFTNWFAPNMTTAEHKTLMTPMLDKWYALGVKISPTFQQFESYLPAWRDLTDAETVGSILGRSTSRLLPVENLKDPLKWNETFTVMKNLVDEGFPLIGYGITGGPGPYPDNAVNPAWRDTALYVIPAISWSAGLSWAEVANISAEFSNKYLKPLRDVSPGAGAYASEGDIMEPDFQQSFYGTDHYARLYAFKKKTDPQAVFYAHEGVGSEDWYVTNQLEGLPTQNGRLCHV